MLKLSASAVLAAVLAPHASAQLLIAPTGTGDEAWIYVGPGASGNATVLYLDRPDFEDNASIISWEHWILRVWTAGFEPPSFPSPMHALWGADGHSWQGTDQPDPQYATATYRPLIDPGLPSSLPMNEYRPIEVRLFSALSVNDQGGADLTRELTFTNVSSQRRIFDFVHTDAYSIVDHTSAFPPDNAYNDLYTLDTYLPGDRIVINGRETEVSHPIYGDTLYDSGRRVTITAEGADLVQYGMAPDQVAQWFSYDPATQLIPADQPTIVGGASFFNAVAFQFRIDLMPGESSVVSLGSTGAIGTPPCNPADLAAPFGLLDLADIVAFVTAFTSQEPAADLAAPFGLFDLADVLAFSDGFVGGCP